MQQFLVPEDVMANLTKDLTDLDVELDQANTLFGRTFWILVVCSILSLLILLLDLFKMYKKWGRKYKEQIPSCVSHRTYKEQIPSCESQHV